MNYNLCCDVMLSVLGISLSLSSILFINVLSLQNILPSFTLQITYTDKMCFSHFQNVVYTSRLLTLQT